VIKVDRKEKDDAPFLSILRVIDSSALDVTHLDTDRRQTDLDRPARRAANAKSDAGESQPSYRREADQPCTLAHHLGIAHRLTAVVHSTETSIAA
jgi:hypothetical protein